MSGNSHIEDREAFNTTISLVEGVSRELNEAIACDAVPMAVKANIPWWFSFAHPSEPVIDLIDRCRIHVNAHIGDITPAFLLQLVCHIGNTHENALPPVAIQARNEFLVQWFTSSPSGHAPQQLQAAPGVPTIGVSKSTILPPLVVGAKSSSTPLVAGGSFASSSFFGNLLNNSGPVSGDQPPPPPPGPRSANPTPVPGPPPIPYVKDEEVKSEGSATSEVKVEAEILPPPAKVAKKPPPPPSPTATARAISPAPIKTGTPPYKSKPPGYVPFEGVPTERSADSQDSNDAPGTRVSRMIKRWGNNTRTSAHDGPKPPPAGIKSKAALMNPPPRPVPSKINTSEAAVNTIKTETRDAINSPHWLHKPKRTETGSDAHRTPIADASTSTEPARHHSLLQQAINSVPECPVAPLAAQLHGAHVTLAESESYAEHALAAQLASEALVTLQAQNAELRRIAALSPEDLATYQYQPPRPLKRPLSVTAAKVRQHRRRKRILTNGPASLPPTIFSIDTSSSDVDSNASMSSEEASDADDAWFARPGEVVATASVPGVSSSGDAQLHRHAVVLPRSRQHLTHRSSNS